MWRRRSALCVLGVWGMVSVARLTRLVEPAEQPPGQEVAAALRFFKERMPADAAYLFVLPAEFGSDTGTAPRLRYELYPRSYDDIRASAGEAAIRQLLEESKRRYVVVPDATQYPPESWLRQPRDWLKRIELDATRYLLEVQL